MVTSNAILGPEGAVAFVPRRVANAATGGDDTNGTGAASHSLHGLHARLAAVSVEPPRREPMARARSRDGVLALPVAPAAGGRRGPDRGEARPEQLVPGGAGPRLAAAGDPGDAPKRARGDGGLERRRGQRGRRCHVRVAGVERHPLDLRRHRGGGRRRAEAVVEEARAGDRRLRGALGGCRPARLARLRGRLVVALRGRRGAVHGAPARVEPSRAPAAAGARRGRLRRAGERPLRPRSAVRGAPIQAPAPRGSARGGNADLHRVRLRALPRPSRRRRRLPGRARVDRRHPDGALSLLPRAAHRRRGQPDARRAPRGRPRQNCHTAHAWRAARRIAVAIHDKKGRLLDRYRSCSGIRSWKDSLWSGG